jgi:hypothetical protein
MAQNFESFGESWGLVNMSATFSLLLRIISNSQLMNFFFFDSFFIDIILFYFNSIHQYQPIQH